MTLFCPKCLDMSVIYVDATDDAVCTNLTECDFTQKFETWEECKKSLKAGLINFAEGQGMKIAPWNGAPIQTDMDDSELKVVTSLARELHGIFTEASLENKMIDQEDAYSFTEIPESVQDVLVQLACYVFNNFDRRKDG